MAKEITCDPKIACCLPSGESEPSECIDRSDTVITDQENRASSQYKEAPKSTLIDHLLTMFAVPVIVPSLVGEFLVRGDQSILGRVRRELSRARREVNSDPKENL